MMDLILASTSPYRRELLTRLGLPFRCLTPEVDETPLPGESASRLARRLALAKATAISRQHPNAWVIGSDQSAEVDGTSLGKPLSHERACIMLAQCAGREARFETAVCLVAGAATPQVRCVTTCVSFRPLDAARINNYLERERPYDCAGGFKVEGLGISLFERIESTDPTALIGLPLITLTDLLEEAGLCLL